jgi:hypothetical protein
MHLVFADARHAGNPDFERLIETLKTASAAFRSWWPRHDVLRRPSNRKRIRHPRAAIMVFDHMSFAVTDSADIKLVVYTPLAETSTQAKLDRLLRDEGTGTPGSG